MEIHVENLDIINMAKHHDTFRYERQLLIKRDARWKERIVQYVDLRIKFIVGALFLGGVMLCIGALLSESILAPSYIFFSIVIIPSLLSTWKSKKQLFFYLSLEVSDKQIYVRSLSRYLLWPFSVFINLMVVGSFSLLVFDLVCFGFADTEVKKESVYVDKIEVDKKSKRRTAHILMQDGLLTQVYHIDEKIKDGKNWEEGSEQVIQVKNSLFGSKILVE